MFVFVVRDWNQIILGIIIIYVLINHRDNLMMMDLDTELRKWLLLFLLLQ